MPHGKSTKRWQDNSRNPTLTGTKSKTLFTKEGFAVMATKKKKWAEPKKEAFFASLTGFNNRSENTRKHGSRYQNIATLT